MPGRLPQLPNLFLQFADRRFLLHSLFVYLYCLFFYCPEVLGQYNRQLQLH